MSPPAGSKEEPVPTIATERESVFTRFEEDGWEIIQRVVFPEGNDDSLWPLYVDWGIAPSSAAMAATLRNRGKDVPASTTLRSLHRPPRRSTRTSVVIPGGERLSLAAYFNAFPAAYWQRWTNVRQVRLSLEIRGEAKVEVLRSSARGTFTTVGAAQGSGRMDFEVPLDRFGDGGWIWPEIVPLEDEAEILAGAWSVPATEGAVRSRVTVGITTFNMAAECVAQANRFLRAPEVLERVAEILIVDQGTRHVADEPGYAEVQEALGDKLRIIEQANLGGSGGFSRAMYEMLENPESDHVLLLDDDAEVEPEGVLRALSFADHALRPVIVGGHMFNLNERTILHSMGETMDMDRFWWCPVNPELNGVDLAQRTIRTDPYLNRRIDVAYNGWWMCLIPKEVVRRIGLSLPFFIKWDDAEYGLRAAANGIRTVSLPGAAVWHVPWTEKDDGLDWQAYFHQRNRWVAALMHSPMPRGGMLPRMSFAIDLKHLLSLQYYASDLRIQGLEDVLEGPAHLHPSIHTRAAEGRALAKEYVDAHLIQDAADFPEVILAGSGGAGGTAPDGKLQMLYKAVRGSLRQLKPMAAEAQERPQTELRNAEARWWKLANLDSALVSNAAGSGAWFYKRDSRVFRRNVTRTLALYTRLAREWSSLSVAYRRALPELVSVESWKRTFGID